MQGAELSVSALKVGKHISRGKVEGFGSKGNMSECDNSRG
jgi:hypothetical protein